MITDNVAKPSIPHNMCPRCGEIMRLNTIEPQTEGFQKSDNFIFECRCGFTLQQKLPLHP